MIPQPERIATRCNVLSYEPPGKSEANQIIPEFTLHLYRKQLENCISSGKYDEYDVIGLAKIYYNLSRFNDFLTLTSNESKRLDSIPILENHIIGKLVLAESGHIDDSAASVLSHWFTSPINESSKPLMMAQSIGGNFTYLGTEINIKQPFRINISIDETFFIHVTSGPIESEIPYTQKGNIAYLVYIAFFGEIKQLLEVPHNDDISHFINSILKESEKSKLANLSYFDNNILESLDSLPKEDSDLALKKILEA